MTNALIYEPLDQMVVRTPLLPISSDLDLDALQPRQKSLALAAIAVGSQSLYRQIQLPNPSSKTNHARRKYTRRMSSRPTPYGLFAGVGICYFGETTDLETTGEIKTHARPDMGFLTQLAQQLESSREILETLTLYANPAAFRVDGKLWLDNGTKNGRNELEIDTLTLNCTEPVQRAFDLSVDGLPFHDLCQELVFEFYGTDSDAKELIFQLCQKSVLLTELRFNPTSWYKVFDYLMANKTIPNVAIMHDDVRQALELLNNWNSSSSNSAESFLELTKAFSVLLKSPPKDTVQVDAKLELLHSNVSRKVGERAALATELLLKLSTSYNEWYLKDYRQKFEKRYPYGREVPLLELLNETLGLGSPFLDSNSVPIESKRQKQLLLLAGRALKMGLNEIELHDSELEHLFPSKTKSTEYPDTVDLFCSVVANTREEIDKGHFQLLISPRTGIVGGGRAFGRFAHLFGSDGAQHLKEIADSERPADNTIIIESDYWTLDARLLNVTIAPNQTKHSVNANCIPSGRVQSVPLREVNVGLHRGRFYARWTRTGQQIVLKGRNALSVAYMPLPIRFLTTISSAKEHELHPFDWGPAWDLMFRPQVKYKGIILCPASWNLQVLAEKVKRCASEQQANVLIETWRQTFQVPSKIVVSNEYWSDSVLILELDDNTDFYLFKEFLRKGIAPHKPVAFEVIDSASWHTTCNGPYETELVVTLRRKPNSTKAVFLAPPSPVRSGVVSSVDFLRPPGSDWLYFRIDCAESIADSLLSSLHAHLDTCTSRAEIMEWFFVKYRDPQPHLRVRIHLRQCLAFSQVFQEVASFLSVQLFSGLVSKYSIETYNREVERYGGVDSMSIVESIFSIDSAAQIQLKKIIKELSLDPIVVAVVYLQIFLTQAGLDVNAQAFWLRQFDSCEFQGFVSKAYREYKNLIYASVFEPTTRVGTNTLCAIEDSLKPAIPLFSKLRELDKYERMTEPLSNVLNSIVHMSLVRFFGTNYQAEVIVRGLLLRTLNSKLNRQKEQSVV